MSEIKKRIKKKEEVSPILFPLLYEACELFCSSVTTLKEEREVGPGCVDIIPRKRVTPQVRTWLYSEHTDRRRKMAGIKKVQTKKKTKRFYFTSIIANKST